MAEMALATLDDAPASSILRIATKGGLNAQKQVITTSETLIRNMILEPVGSMDTEQLPVEFFQYSRLELL